jgi:EmrB/QacA subfamily drug resistance transporter
MTTSVAERATRDTRSDGPNLSHRQILTILAGLMCGMFLAALDQTIVGTSVVRIANDLHGFEMQAWITTAYLITSTISTPIYGKLSDIYGRKALYLSAITIFLLGSIGSSFAESMVMLAGSRAVQGLGGGGLMSLAMTILGDIVSPRQRAKYQGYFLAVFGTSTVLGPVLGGLFAGMNQFAGMAGWRWVFLINVPFGLIALAVVSKVLNVPTERQEQSIDWWGAITLIVCVVPLLLIAEQGAKWGWGSTSALVCYGIGAVGLVLFLVAEALMRDAALIPLRLFRNGTFSVAILGGVIVGVAMFGAITMIPQYLQVVQGYTPTQSGLAMLPLMGGMMLASITSGRITARTGRYKVFPIIGTLLVAIGAVLFAQVHYDTPIQLSLGFAAIIGLGLGNCMQTLVIAVQNAGPRSDMGVSTAASTFFRQMGGTMGVAIFLTILFNVLPGNIERAFGGRIPAGGGGKLGDLQSNTQVIAQLPEAIRVPVLIGFTNSINTVFYAASGVALVACVVLLFMREIPLRGGAPSAAVMEGGEALIASSDDEAPTQEIAAVTPPAFSGELDSGEPAGRAEVVGTVSRPDGRPVPGAQLTVIDQNGHQVSRGTCASDGSFAVPVPGQGTYVLIVSAATHQPEASNVTVGSRSVRADVVLAGSGEISGFVRSAETGQPVVGAAVTLADEHGEVTGSVVTGEDGRYRLHCSGAGDHTVVVSAAEHRPAALTVTVADSGLVERDIDLVGVVWLRGTARNTAGATVPDARITVLDRGGDVAAVAQTDDDGSYAISDLPAGDYTLVASGYLPATAEVSLVGGAEVSHDVWLSHDTSAEDADSTARG